MSLDRHQDKESEYVAWDGNNYPGDPPEGWYLANDNRWWPSEQIINKSNGYADPYGPEYQFDPAFDAPDPATAAEPIPPAPTSPPATPSRIESSPPPAFDPPPRSLDTTPPPLDIRLPQPDENIASPPPPPRQAGFGGSASGAGGPRPQAPTRPRRRSQRGRGISIIIFAAIALARCAGGIGDDDNDTQINVPTSPPTIVPSEDGLREEGFGFPGASPFVAEPGLSIDAPTPCPAADGSSERTTRFAEAPPMCIDLDKTYEADLITDRGTISIALDHDTAPLAVNNFVVLSRYSYYDNVPFHEIVDGSWVQTGEPFGPSTSDGGPGYSIEVEPPPDRIYPADSVFLATFGGNPHASQFAFATGSSADSGLDALLEGRVSRFGTVIEGSETLTDIESGPTEGTAALDPTYITSIQIRELN